MTMDYLKEKKELVSVALLCVSVVLAVSILVKVTGFFTASVKAENIVKTAIAQTAEDANDIDKYFAKYKKLAEALKKNNLFAPPEPKQHPVKEIAGIFGDEVIIRDKLYKVGDKVGDATIVSIESTQVTIEWDGKKKTFSPTDAGGSLPPGEPRSSKRSAKGGPARPSGGTAQMVTIQSQNKQMGVYDGTLKKDGITKDDIKTTKDKFQNMSEQEKQKMMEIKERWPTMSEEERERAKAAMRERFGDGGKQDGKGQGGK